MCMKLNDLYSTPKCCTEKLIVAVRTPKKIITSYISCFQDRQPEDAEVSVLSPVLSIIRIPTPKEDVTMPL